MDSKTFRPPDRLSAPGHIHRSTGFLNVCSRHYRCLWCTLYMYNVPQVTDPLPYLPRKTTGEAMSAQPRPVRDTEVQLDVADY